ncbi:MAG: TetR/AcrR family transcriptional regulator [Muribaculaceae bacterium]|nr:TetR/AcrR family transcriptional regulator [Roseburia sp.]MCM1432039.1 TetR/AcrR family transcriptional regulator [Muribaculaceae bacterium]MCM1493911.1 TetR/AcrR family transcriptional regulator [Muribaculaceae bacterium]
MGKSRFRLEDFSNPPPKVRLMFEAVSALLAEKADIADLKVSDIMAQAGLGKGTAYEYFSSKEELTAMALIYEYGKKITELKKLVDSKAGFSDKVYGILDWLHENSSYHMTFICLIQMATGIRNPCQSLRSCIPEELFTQMHDYLCENGDAIMEQGYKEGVYTETDVMKRRMAMATMVLQFAMTMGEKSKDSLFVMDYETLRPYAYGTLVKMLN